jgi:UV DNA damage endonuclease
MLEGKAKDLSLLRLRGDLVRYAPDVAIRFGLSVDDAAALAEDEALVEDHADAEQEADVDEGEG